MLMEMFMKEIGLMIKLMGSVFTLIWMEQGMKDIGRKTNSMERDKKLGQMELYMMETM